MSQFSSVQSLRRVQLFATPWTAARQASLSITNSWSLLKPVSIESVMPSSHLILGRPLLLPPSVFPSIRVFSSESVLHIRWPKYWSFSISPSSEYSGFESSPKKEGLSALSWELWEVGPACLERSGAAPAMTCPMDDGDSSLESRGPAGPGVTRLVEQRSPAR